MKALALALLAACGGGGGHDGPCARMVGLARSCPAWSKVPSSGFDSMGMFCAVSRAYRLANGEQPGNLADLDKRAMDECTAATSCDDLAACFTHNACELILSGPDDRSPQFDCMPAP